MGQTCEENHIDREEVPSVPMEGVVILELLSHVLNLAREAELTRVAAQIERTRKNCVIILGELETERHGMEIRRDGPCN